MRESESEMQGATARLPSTIIACRGGSNRGVEEVQQWSLRLRSTNVPGSCQLDEVGWVVEIMQTERC